jgi:hypothetical protein
VTSYLLYAFQAYCLGTGATFIRIYNFKVVWLPLGEWPTLFSILWTQHWSNPESCAGFRRLEGLSFCRCVGYWNQKVLYRH